MSMQPHFIVELHNIIKMRHKRSKCKKTLNVNKKNWVN